MGTVDRRTFIRATGSAAALSLSARLSLAQTPPEVRALHRLLEETPHERVAAELATLIRDGLDHRRTLVALAVATSRNVQPFPDVGFKYHTVLALQSVHLTALNLPDEERWLPVFWSLDNFKRTQAEERRESGWTMGSPPEPVAGTAEAARKNLIDALDRWDREAVDSAILDFARLAPPDQLSELLFRYSTRDLREIGHKASPYRTCTASCRSSDPNTRHPCFAPWPRRSRITATTRILPSSTYPPIEPGESSSRCSEGSRRRGNRAGGTTTHAMSL